MIALAGWQVFGLGWAVGAATALLALIFWSLFAINNRRDH